LLEAVNVALRGDCRSLADDFDDLPEAVEGVASARMLLIPGVLVYATILYDVLADDGAVDPHVGEV